MEKYEIKNKILEIMDFVHAYFFNDCSLSKLQVILFIKEGLHHLMWANF